MKSYFTSEDNELCYIVDRYNKVPSAIIFRTPKKISDLKELVKDWKLERTILSESKEYRYVSYLYKQPRNFFEWLFRKEPLFIKFSEEFELEEIDLEDYEDLVSEDNITMTVDDSVGEMAGREWSGVTLYHGIIEDPTELEVYEKIMEIPSMEESPKNNLYLTSQGADGRLFLREFNLKNKIEVDLDLNYNDDFKPIHSLVEERVKSSDKGIIMFHGIPGTGKTSYVKWFLQNTPKKVIFMPPYLATQLSSPSFINFVADSCKDSLLVIEDAEEVLASRSLGGNTAISNLLNITDGLLSDIFNIQILATFNCKISEIDEALKRKGRIIAEYEFKELAVDKAQKLSDKLGFNSQISKPTVLTDVFNQTEQDFKKKETGRVGFVK